MAENTNYYQVLDLAGVQQLWNTAKQTFVQTVNGQGIDANGNVNVSSVLTTDEGNFVKSEYDKCLNLANPTTKRAGIQINGTNGSLVTNNGYYSYFIPIEPNTSYVISNVDGSGCVLYSGEPSSSTYISTVNYTFTSPSNAKYVGFTRPNSETNLPMLNKGNTALPYQAYNGTIVHQKDVEAVLLWENATPNQRFDATTLTLNTLPNFDYIIIGCQFNVLSGNKATQYFIIKKILNCYAYVYIPDDSTSDVHKRHIQFYSSNQIAIGSGYKNLSVDNDVCTPIEIWGTNKL